jgi:integrase
MPIPTPQRDKARMYNRPEGNTRMPLKDTRIRNAKLPEKPYKLADGGGLYIEIKPNGSKLWRLRYRLAGKENVFAIGEYPAIGLADARAERDAAKKIIRDGMHPSHHRKLERARRAHENANTFEAVAREWIAHNAEHWTAKTLRQRRHVLERDVFPTVGSLPVRQVTPTHVLSIVKRVEKRALAMAVLVNQAIGSICRYAMVTLRADIDPTRPLRGSLRPRQVEHHKPLSRGEIPGFIRALEAYPGYFSNKMALHLVLLTLVRTTEMLEARWSEFDLGAALWRIPAERMKMREPHIVPLSRRAVELLRELHTLTGGQLWLFPNYRRPKTCMTATTMNRALERMGFNGKGSMGFSAHGFRATASTILNEMGFRPDVIERQLAHKERNKVRASYNRAEYLGERREMMQVWADLIEEMVKEQSKVIPGRFGMMA